MNQKEKREFDPIFKMFVGAVVFAAVLGGWRGLGYLVIGLGLGAVAGLIIELLVVAMDLGEDSRDGKGGRKK